MMARRRKRLGRRPRRHYGRRRSRKGLNFFFLVVLVTLVWALLYVWDEPLPLNRETTPAPPPAPQGVATYADGVITEDELLRALQRELYGEFTLSPEENDVIRSLLSEFTDDEIRGTLQRLVALEVLFFSPEGQERRDSPAFRTRYQFEEQKHYAHWMLDWLQDNLPTPSEDEMQAYIEEQREQFEQPEVFLARQLFVNIDLYGPPAEKRSPATARQLADELRGRVESGEDFIDLIQQHSESPSRKRDGLVGPFQAGQVLEVFEDFVRELEAGEIGEPLALEDGYTIVQLVNRKPAGLPDLDMIREEVESALVEERFALALEEALDQAEELAEVPFDASAALTGGRNERVLYRVGDFTMTLGDLWAWYQDLSPVLRDHYTRTTGVPDTGALRGFVEETYQESLLAAMAEARDIPQLDRYRQLRHDRLLLAVSTGLLDQRTDALLDAMTEDTDRLQEFYESDPLRFQSPPEIHLESARLDLEVEDAGDRRALFRADVKARENADDLYQALETGADLKELRDHPAEPAIVEEWALLSELDPALQQAVAGLHLESATLPVLLPPLRTEAGYVIPRVLDWHPGQVPPFEEVAPEVAEAFRSEMLPEAEEKAIQQILNEAGFASSLDRWLMERREQHVESPDRSASL